MSDKPMESIEFALPVIWVDLNETPILMANQFVGQTDKGHAVLTVGQIAPPMILSTDPAEVRATVERLGYAPVRTMARYSMSIKGLEELRHVIEQTIENYVRMNGGDP